jgi:competence protein ComEA
LPLLAVNYGLFVTIYTFYFDYSHVMNMKNWLRGILLLFLLIITITGIIFARCQYIASLPVEISLSSPVSATGTVYIDGGIAVPGYYPFFSGDTINDLIQAAGGTNDQADFTNLKLYIPLEHENYAQKIDINRADAWLLQALPGIGDTLAKRIIDYRQQNGPFPDISSIKNISGIGEGEFSRIKEFITASGK